MMRRTYATRFIAILGILLATAMAPDVVARSMPSVARAAVIAAVSLPDEQVEAIRRRIARWREDRGIPGLAVALVIRGEILLVDGFGVDPNARLPIGSVENALRAVVTATEVDAGRMGWDSPLEESLGESVFSIRSLDDSARVQWSDVLLHRTGLVGMDILAGSATIPTAQILRFNVKRAEPWGDFRARILRNDGLWLAIEEALSRRAGTDWESLLYERLTGPLGMHATSARRSTATDLARFVRFLLGDGIVDGRVIVARSTLDDLMRERATDENGVAYGFGFANGSWEGQRVVTSIGSRSGSARIVLLPKADVGAVAIWTGWPDEITLQDFEALWPLVIGEWVEGLEPFIGRYVANFGRFRDEVFRVHVKDERLHVNIPGEQDYMLKWPGTDGRWTYEVSDQVAVSFDRDDDGSVVQMRLHMDGVEIELPREGSVNPDPLPEEVVAPLLGRYRSEDYLRDVRVDLDDGVLFLDWPDWSIVELAPARVDGAIDPWGRWRFELLPERGLRFERDADGGVTAMVLLDDGRELERLPRVSDEPPPGLPTRKELLALRAAHSDPSATASGTWRFTGTARRPQAGIAGSFRWDFDAEEDRHAWAYDFGVYGRILPDDSSGRPAGPHPAVLFGEIGEAYSRMRAVRRAEIGGRRAIVTELSDDAMHVESVAAFDETNGDLLQFESGAGSLFAGPTVWRFLDWKTVEGVRVPFRFESADDHYGTCSIEIASLDRLGEGEAAYHPAPRFAPVVGEPIDLALSTGRVRLFAKRLVDAPHGVPSPIVLCVPPAAYRGRVYFDFGLRGRSIVDDFARRGFEVFVVDATESGRAVRAGELGEIVEYLEQHSGTRGVRLVGVAEGARTAMELAGAAPERVERLVAFGLPVTTTNPNDVGFVDHATMRRETSRDLAEERVAPDVAAELTIARARARSGDVRVARPSSDTSASESGEDPDDETEIAWPDPAAIRVPLLVVDGQWEFEVPGQAADASEVAARARLRDDLASWFDRVPSRVKSRERIIGAGLFAPFGDAAGEWRDVVGAFLETPIERSVDALASRLRGDLDARASERGQVPVVRFRLPDGREGTVLREADATADAARIELPSVDWFEPMLVLRAAVDRGIVERDRRVVDWLAGDARFEAIPRADSMTIADVLESDVRLGSVDLSTARTDAAVEAAMQRIADSGGATAGPDAKGARYSGSLVIAARLVDAWPSDWRAAARSRGSDERDTLTSWRGSDGIAAVLDRARGTVIVARVAADVDIDERARAWLDALHRP